MEASDRRPPERCWVDVADRGADMFEFLATENRLGRSYLVRACHNRVVTTPAGERVKLYDHLRSLPGQGKPFQRKIHDPRTHEPRLARWRSPGRKCGAAAARA